LIRPKKISWAKERNLRSRIDRKSADFVLCDREQIVPRLVIELDGSAHDLKKKKERDEFINEITESIGLPLLRLKVGDVDKESIRGKISKKL
jgi:very-short-patch-repair endonuclease